MPGDFGLRHPGIMLQRQRGEASPASLPRQMPLKADDGADILAAVRERGDLPRDVEIGFSECGWSRQRSWDHRDAGNR